MQGKDGTEYKDAYVQKAWITGSIYALIVVVLLLIEATFSVLLLILAGILIAVFFRGLSYLIERKTGWKTSVSLTISVIGTLLVIVLLLWLIGAKVQQQVSQLTDTLPSTIDNAENYLKKSQIGQKILDKVNSSNTEKQAQSVATNFFKTTFGVFGDVYVILFMAIFFTISPHIYKKGIVQMVPKKGHPAAEDALNKLGLNLEKWLKGKLLSMLVVFILTAIGLAIMGIEMWLVLALIAGLLSFIPNFGPLIAIIPAVLIGLMDGPTTAALIAGLYILIQVVESNIITPMIQQKMLNLPPALVLIAQLLIGALTGGWGLLLATPFLVIIMVLVQQLYINKNQ